MFLASLQAQNPGLIQASLALHQQGLIEPDSYVLDYQAIMANARQMVQAAAAQQIKLYAMTKQFGRIPQLAQSIIEAGFAGVVCVDYREACLMIDHGVKIGHVGHLVQVPDGLLRKIIAARPDIITVYSIAKAQKIAKVAAELGLVQAIMLKVYAPGDNLYPQQEAGFALDELPAVVAALQPLAGICIDGITHFPCFLYDSVAAAIVPTVNTQTVLTAKQILADLGVYVSQINLPSSTCVASIPLIAACGGTHGEPGHGLTGTTMYHATHPAAEKIASLYLSEISHQFDGHSFCYGGGHYRRSHLQSAWVDKQHAEVIAPDPQAIDYHFTLKGLWPIGAPVVMCFRTQIFVTRSQVVLLDGVAEGQPVILGRFDAQGRSL